MFGLLVGTLKKAEREDKERNASEAAKKRMKLEARLQSKLRRENDTVRKAEDARKDKLSANRKEEELQLRDSVVKYRRSRLPILANFLLTSDVIPQDQGEEQTRSLLNPLANPPRSHPPPLYYLPAILLPSQEAFISARRSAVKDAAEAEWQMFHAERVQGIEDVKTLRLKVEEAKKSQGEPMDEDTEDAKVEDKKEGEEGKKEGDVEARMDTDELEGKKDDGGEKEKDEPMQAIDDEAVEY
ncbi:uncharacterized protein BT62DRAFT_966788 [Guyanagaster necrorhizus]|uniref:Pinin/SDK/MemA protein domain-containing protein n=1 Tax=Guyanagaster necrorhizus TaxID=856835 RepID=A0A9P7VVK0_9AGAR|nr:uncharacterized protein BT62DRAFT_966788 [Guyanagaster necrorhizus MCA 3950]KAG7447729.1 hypothetical protein BT62DRAFT_966788 [Guyanagaster necrorhizus MCA 3950]